MARSESRPTNRLIHEPSPYLQQHAHNPVDWYPWSEEAFARARAEDKPVFLSIGYATCHWCHVMERESFEDPQVAALMNEAFVNVKVDREERPDIDSVYMTVCQAMTGSGGWPLTIVMTPDKQPFYAATYIPKDNRFGRVGMLELVPRLREFWRQRRNEALDLGERVSQALQQLGASRPGSSPHADTLYEAYRDLSSIFDHERGGFGKAPKFPVPHHLLFLLRYWHRTGEQQALDMVTQTLQAMRRGGIYDHVGFGFHRYSTDADWLVPHFEKMLYDQALLTLAYLETCQATGDSQYAEVARELITYVLRDMTSPDGAFYSAEDADSEGVEGKFYVWTVDELAKVLGAEGLALARVLWSVADKGNFAEEASGRPTGHNILHQTQSLAEVAERLGCSQQDLLRHRERLRELLHRHRRERIRPLRDDKILTDWNGLMIAALARAGVVLGEAQYTRAAVTAAEFIRRELTLADGYLLHRFRDGQAGLSGYLDDYAFLTWGLLELYEATFEPRWLDWAMDLTQQLVQHWWDESGGGFFFTSEHAEPLLVRSKDLYDGAIPSGNAVALSNLLRLARLTGRTELEGYADRMLRAFGAQVRSNPTAHTHLLSALDFALGPTREVVIAGDPASASAQPLLRAARSGYRPRQVLLLKSAETAAALGQLAPYTAPLPIEEHQAVAYVCNNGACELPTSDPGELTTRLDQ
ncbi:MAG: thioredoxin domain-containing protein [Armatimonadetes bacterium]|nr:thioredoxin domain-containing protein [Armatimonadota bacterium]